MRPQCGEAGLTEYQKRKGKKAVAPLNATTHWTRPGVALTAVLPQQQAFRYDPIPRVEVALLPDEDGEDYRLNRIDPGKRRWEKRYVEIDDGLNHRIPDAQVRGARITPWGQTDYLTELAALAEERDMSALECAERYGTVTLPDNTQGWRFHPALGFTRKK